jgi:hypothetical protein
MGNMSVRRVLGIALLILGIVLIADAVVGAFVGGHLSMLTILWSLLFLGFGVIAVAKQ